MNKRIILLMPLLVMFSMKAINFTIEESEDGNVYLITPNPLKIEISKAGLISLYALKLLEKTMLGVTIANDTNTLTKETSEKQSFIEDLFKLKKDVEDISDPNVTIQEEAKNRLDSNNDLLVVVSMLLGEHVNKRFSTRTHNPFAFMQLMNELSNFNTMMSNHPSPADNNALLMEKLNSNKDKTNPIEKEIKKHSSPAPGMPNFQGATKAEDNN